MADPARRIVRILAGLATSLTIVACGGSPIAQGNRADPILVRGTVLDDSGSPITAASVQILVLDYTNPDRLPQGPVVYREVFGVDQDGSFEIHLGATPQLKAFTARYGPWVAFDLTVMGPFSSVISSIQFARQLQGGEWLDEVPVVQVTPTRITVDGVEPQAPGPGPT